ncbi:hypothetical protein OG21DRAFT_1116143 [Imleria badia]|nr:hypothetical protein OG21DRAFT_1116143 [Imleria badia]
MQPPQQAQLPRTKVKCNLVQRLPRLQSLGHSFHRMRRPSHLRPCWDPHARCVSWRRIAKILRDHMRGIVQYGSLKHLYLSGTLVKETDTSPWRVKTPNRADVINMLDKMIKVVDEELSDEGLMSIGNAVLPHIVHWNRLVTVLSNRAVGVITILPALLGVSVLAALGAMVLTSFYLCASAYVFLKQLRSRGRDSVPDEHGGESSQGVEMMHTRGGGDTQGTTSATS